MSDEKVIKQDGKTYRQDWKGDWKPDTDWKGDAKVETDWKGAPKIKTDWKGDQKIETDWKGDPIVQPDKKQSSTQQTIAGVAITRHADSEPRTGKP